MKRLQQLDGLRFIMIMMVVISHLHFLSDSKVVGTVYQNHIQNGSLPVDFFFMLSGFGIYYVSRDKNLSHSLKHSILYAINKMKKIYPVYIMSLVIGMIRQIQLFYIIYNITFLRFVLRTIVHILLCIPMLQSLSGITSITHAINGVCWYLSCIFICYMFCPSFVKYVNKATTKKKSFIGLLATVGIIMILSLIAFTIDTDGRIWNKIDNIWYSHPFIRCFYLLMGMFIAKIALLKNMQIKHNTFYEVMISCSYIVYFIFRNILTFNMNFIRLFDICITAVFIYVFSFGGGVISRLLSKNTIVNLGNNAMYIFLLHYPVRLLIGNINLYNYIGEWTYVVLILLIIIFTTLAIYVCKKIQNYVWNKVSFLFEYANKKLS